MWPGDVINDVMNMYLHKCSHNLTIPMHRKFCDDIFACFLVIMKNIVIWFIMEYRGHPMTSSSWKYFLGKIWDDLFISEVRLKLCWIFQNFQNGRHFELATNFFTGNYTGSWIYQKDSHEHFRHFELLIDALAQILTEIWAILIITGSPKFKVRCFVISLLFN